MLQADGKLDDTHSNHSLEIHNLKDDGFLFIDSQSPNTIGLQVKTGTLSTEIGNFGAQEGAKIKISENDVAMRSKSSKSIITASSSGQATVYGQNSAIITCVNNRARFYVVPNGTYEADANVQTTDSNGKRHTMTFPKSDGTVALTSDIPTIYHHFIQIIGNAPIGYSGICFDAYSSKNTEIDSVEALCSVFGNTQFSISCTGALTDSHLYIQIGTSKEDVYIYTASDGNWTSTLLSVWFATSMSITDSVMAL